MTDTFKETHKFRTKLGFISYGGPAGQIAIMHQEVVEEFKRRNIMPLAIDTKEL